MQNTGVSYIISKNGSNFQAENTASSTVQFTNASASSVINSVLTAMNTSANGGGGTAQIKNGIYPIDKAILMKNFTGLVGESKEKTILRSTTDAKENTIFRYWAGASSALLEGFSISNLKLEINNLNGSGGGSTEPSWISSGTKDCTISNIWVKSFSKPSTPKIGLFLDTANRTNNNQSTRVTGCKFEGPCGGQDMLGCGCLVDCDFSHNEFRDCDAQAIGIGKTTRSIISNNRFYNTGNAIGYENYCDHNTISGNILYNTHGIKLSEEGSSGTNISRNNKCIDNHIIYGMGGIEAGISVEDEIKNNMLYRSERNGIRGSFLRCIIDDNTFIDTNYSWASRTMIGNTSAQNKIGGIIAFNSKYPNMKNEWNSFSNNLFLKSGESFTVGTAQTKTGDPGGVVIDTAYKNSIISPPNKGNLGSNLLKNYGSLAP